MPELDALALASAPAPGAQSPAPDAAGVTPPTPAAADLFAALAEALPLVRKHTDPRRSTPAGFVAVEKFQAACAQVVTALYAQKRDDLALVVAELLTL